MSPSLTPKKPQADLGRYERYQKAAGASTKDLHEEISLRIGPWGFYYRNSQPGAREDVVAIDAAGTAVSGNGPSEWYALLSAEGLDADAAMRRVCWLLVRPAPVGADHEFKDPAVAASIGPPSLDVDGGTATLQGWVIYPPETEAPFSLRIGAQPDTPTTAEVTPWPVQG